MPPDDNYASMVFPHLLSTLRYLGRNKLNTALHLTGLTLGMSVCLLIGLLLHYEWSFDGYHDKADRTYRVISTYSDASTTNYHFATPLPLADALRSEVAGLEHVGLAHPYGSATVELDADKRFAEERLLAVEPEFLGIFDIQVLAGDASEALGNPYQAVLTETLARKYFGEENPLGKTFRINDAFDITVGAVVRDQPSNTHLPFTMLLSYVADERFLGADPNSWGMIQANATYLVLPSTTDIPTVKTRLTELANQHINSNPNLPKDIRGGFELQPLQDIHFEAEYGGGSAWVNSVDPAWLWSSR